MPAPPPGRSVVDLPGWERTGSQVVDRAAKADAERRILPAVWPRPILSGDAPRSGGAVPSLVPDSYRCCNAAGHKIGLASAVECPMLRSRAARCAVMSPQAAHAGEFDRCIHRRPANMLILQCSQTRMRTRRPRDASPPVNAIRAPGVTERTVACHVYRYVPYHSQGA